MAKFSTGLRDSMLNDSGFKALMDGGFLKIYAVASPTEVPTSADDAEAGDLLMTLTSGSDGTTGLGFEPPSGGIIRKASSEVWGTASVDQSGQCAYFRLVALGDDGTESTTAHRVQGTCGVVGSDMVLTNLVVVAGDPWTLNYFNVALPTQ